MFKPVHTGFSRFALIAVLCTLLFIGCGGTTGKQASSSLTVNLVYDQFPTEAMLFVFHVINPETGLDVIEPHAVHRQPGVDSQVITLNGVSPGNWSLLIEVRDANGATLTYAGQTIQVNSGGTTDVTVDEAVTLTAINISPPQIITSVGATLEYQAIGIFSDASQIPVTSLVSWASTDTGVATITTGTQNPGVATSVAPGSTTITASLGQVTGSASLVIMTMAPGLQSIEITPASASVACGFSQQFSAIGTFSDGSTLNITSSAVWSSGNSAIATVSNALGSNGLVRGTGVGAGVPIQATFNGVTGTGHITVTPATLQSLAITPASPTLNQGTSQQLTATGTFSDGTTQDLTGQVTWNSSDTSLVAVSNIAGSQGMATVNSVTSGKVTVTAQIGAFTASTPVEVDGLRLVDLQIVSNNAATPVGFKQQMTAIGRFSDMSSRTLTGNVTWTTGDSSVAIVSNLAPYNGELTGLQAGPTTVTARYGDISVSSNITVSNATLSSLLLAPGNLPKIAPGRIEGFSAYGTFSDGSRLDVTTSAVWASSNGAIATISNSPGTHGQATGVAPGSTDITASIGAVTSPVQALNVDPASTDYTEERIPFEFHDISSTGTIATTGDDAFTALPAGEGFDFTFYGIAYTPDKIFVTTNGFISFDVGDDDYHETVLPTAAVPNNLIAAYWGDRESTVYVQTLGIAPNRRLIVQWYGNDYDVDTPPFFKTQAVLYEGTGIIDIRWMSTVADGGNGSTFGVENGDGTKGTQHGYHNQSVLNATAIRFRP